MNFIAQFRPEPKSEHEFPLVLSSEVLLRIFSQGSYTQTINTKYKHEDRITKQEKEKTNSAGGW